MGLSKGRMKQAIMTSALDKIEIIEGDQAKKRFCFKSDFIGFKGHFPNYPLLPAFVQIMTGIILVEEQKKVPLKLVSVSNAKFLIQIRPNQKLTVDCKDFTSGEKKGSLIRISTSEGLASSFKLAYELKGEDVNE